MYEKWLQAFHRVATEGSFTAAAAALNVGQPTVSTHIRTLEDHFGVELFFRRGRRVALTPVGETLLTITRGLYAHEAEAIRFLQNARALEAGRIELAAIGAFDVIELLDAFRQDYPAIEARVSVTSADDVLTGIRDFRTDVAIIGDAVGDPDIHCQFYSRHEVLVIVNAAHRLAKRTTVRLRDLDGANMILRAAPSTTRAVFEAASRAAGIEIRPAIEIDSREAMREAVVRGFGFAVITDIHLVPHRDVRALRIADAEVFTQTYVVCLQERRERPIIRAFLDTADRLARSR